MARLLLSTHTRVKTVKNGQCTSSVPESIMYRRTCDPSGFIVVERVVTSRVGYPIVGGMCRYVITTVIEAYLTDQKCKPEDPIPPGDWATEWLAIASTDVPEVGREDPPDPYPSKTFEQPDPQGCATTVTARFTSECVRGKLLVSRILLHTIRTPMPDGRCHTIEYESRERYATDEPCDPNDASDPKLAERLWHLRVSQPDPPVSTPTPGALYLGDERDVPRPVRPAVEKIQRLEREAGVVLSGPEPRRVFLRSMGGQPASHQLLGSLVSGKLYECEVAIEDSDFTATLEVVAG